MGSFAELYANWVCAYSSVYYPKAISYILCSLFVCIIFIFTLVAQVLLPILCGCHYVCNLDCCITFDSETSKVTNDQQTGEEDKTVQKQKVRTSYILRLLLPSFRELVTDLYLLIEYWVNVVSAW